MDGYNTLFLTNYFSLVQSKLFEEDTLRRMLIPGVNRDLEGSLMLYTERTTPCVSTPDSRPLGEHSHEKPKIYRVNQSAMHKRLCSEL